MMLGNILTAWSFLDRFFAPCHTSHWCVMSGKSFSVNDKNSYQSMKLETFIKAYEWFTVQLKIRTNEINHILIVAETEMWPSVTSSEIVRPCDSRLQRHLTSPSFSMPVELPPSSRLSRNCMSTICVPCCAALWCRCSTGQKNLDYHCGYLLKK